MHCLPLRKRADYKHVVTRLGRGREDAPTQIRQINYHYFISKTLSCSINVFNILGTADASCCFVRFPESN